WFFHLFRLTRFLWRLVHGLCGLNWPGWWLIVFVNLLFGECLLRFGLLCFGLFPPFRRFFRSVLGWRLLNYLFLDLLALIYFVIWRSFPFRILTYYLLIHRVLLLNLRVLVVILLILFRVE